MWPVAGRSTGADLGREHRTVVRFKHVEALSL
jgi:hypothetical protein